MIAESNKADEIRAWFRLNPNRLTIKASRHFGVSEVTVMEALKPEWPLTELRADSFGEIMEGLRKAGLVRIMVRNGQAVLEADGNLQDAKYSTTGAFFNIDGGSVDIHIMHKDITKVFALKKRSHMNAENITYSFQFYTSDGSAVMKVFLWQDFPRIPAASVDVYNEIIKKTALPSENAVH